jgi:hypothetical protein
MFGEEAKRLERSRDAALADLVRLQADDAPVIEQDVARVQVVDAGDDVEERRLAGAVRLMTLTISPSSMCMSRPERTPQAAERERHAAQPRSFFAIR